MFANTCSTYFKNISLYYLLLCPFKCTMLYIWDIWPQTERSEQCSHAKQPCCFYWGRRRFTLGAKITLHYHLVLAYVCEAGQFSMSSPSPHWCTRQNLSCVTCVSFVLTRPHCVRPVLSCLMLWLAGGLPQGLSCRCVIDYDFQGKGPEVMFIITGCSLVMWKKQTRNKR